MFRTLKSPADLEPFSVQVEIYGVVKGVLFGIGALVREDNVQRGLVGVEIVPAVEHIGSTLH